MQQQVRALDGMDQRIDGAHDRVVAAKQQLATATKKVPWLAYTLSNIYMLNILIYLDGGTFIDYIALYVVSCVFLSLIRSPA